MNHSKWIYMCLGIILGVFGAMLMTGRSIEPMARGQDVGKEVVGQRYSLSTWADPGSSNTSSDRGAYIVDQQTGEVYYADGGSLRSIGFAGKPAKK